MLWILLLLQPPSNLNPYRALVERPGPVLKVLLLESILRTVEEGIDRGEIDVRSLLASVCVVASLLCFSGCGPVPLTPSVDRPTIYAFSAPGCLGCARDKPRLEQLECAGYSIQRVDITIYPEWRQKYSINAVPFYLVVCHGKIVLQTHNLNLVIRAIRNGCSVQKKAMSQLP